MNRTEAGQAFLNDLLSRIPEEQRGAAQAAIDAAGDEIANFAGEHTLRQADYSRKMNETQQYYNELKTWHETAKAQLANPQQTSTPNPSDPSRSATPPAGLTREEYEKDIRDRELGVGNFVAHVTTLGLRHFREFGEELDVPSILADPEVTKLGVQGVYEKRFGPKIQEKRNAASEAAIADRINAAIAEDRAKRANQPLHLGNPSLAGSPLDALEGTPGQADSVVDAATAHYEQLRQQHYAGQGAGR